MNIAIIGGGASGLFCANLLCDRHRVTVFERNSRVGKKLLVTGNGRCNYTNTNVQISSYHTDNEKVVKDILADFSPEATIRYFQLLGIEEKIEDMGKVFPQSEQAASVLDALRYHVEKKSTIVLDELIKKINPKSNGIELIGSETYIFDKVIVAVGGKAMPKSGSDGQLFSVLEKLGHKMNPLYPGLVQLMLKGTHFPFLNGTKISGKVSVKDMGEILQEELGDILFTDYGVSGPPVLQCSRTVSRLLSQEHFSTIELDLYHRYSERQLRDILERRRVDLKDMIVEKFLLGLVHKKVNQVILKESGIDKNKKVSSITDEELDLMIRFMKYWEFDVTGTKNFQNAQVSGGGVSLTSVTNDLESKVVKGLYFIGEVLDVDGRSGGFNLQWAWSSSYRVYRSIEGKI